MSPVGQVASILLGAVFLASGASKIAAGRAWPDQARALGTPAVLIPAVPWAEIALGAVTVMRLAPVVAAAVALVVLAGFTVLLLSRLREGRHPPCACFGTWSTKPLGYGHVVRNVGLMVLAAASMLG